LLYRFHARGESRRIAYEYSYRNTIGVRVHKMALWGRYSIEISLGDFFIYLERMGYYWCDMKVVAFNGSARKDGNTAVLVNVVFKELKKEGIKTELIQLAGRRSMDALPAENVSRTRTSNAR